MPIRPSAVAGLFYPACATSLAERVDAWVGAAGAAHARRPKALIAPHSRYEDCGHVLGAAWATVHGRDEGLERVVLIGPSHRVPVLGVVADSASWMQTPLGAVEVDRSAIDGLPNVGRHPAAHALEHSLEVQLPFLMRVAPAAQVVPLVVGRASTREVRAVIEALWGGDETLFVISTDLSHEVYGPTAVAYDEDTALRVEAKSASELDDDRACAASALSALVGVARAERLHVERLALSRANRVGHGAWALYETDA